MAAIEAGAFFPFGAVVTMVVSDGVSSVLPGWPRLVVRLGAESWGPHVLSSRALALVGLLWGAGCAMQERLEEAIFWLEDGLIW
jgi:hypothetical protein